jgi:DNA-binding transcriptional LysR family regulator
MSQRFYALPPLTTLAVFEAAARHAGFSLAASELNVTPGAVSRQIRALEADLGAPLFLRHNRGVVLTEAGEALQSVLAQGFSRTSEVVRSIRRGDLARRVTLACSDVFGSMWLVPRMPDFWRRFPQIKVDHLISDTPRDLRRAEVELRIRFGAGSWAEETAEKLFDEKVYPVCSPAFAAAHPGVVASDLPRLPLLEVDWVAPDWLSWEDLLTQAGLRPEGVEDRRFSKFSVAIAAAMADQGVVIGWHRIVAPLVASGQLVRLTDLEMVPNGAYYLTCNTGRTLSPAGAQMRDWLLEQAFSPMP